MKTGTITRKQVIISCSPAIILKKGTQGIITKEYELFGTKMVNMEVDGLGYYVPAKYVDVQE